MSRYMFIGAHPDDADILFSGTAIKLVRNGHEVQFVSVVNGDAGHQTMDRASLARRRSAEAQKSAGLIGLSEYRILNHHDCELDCSPANREEIVRLIRRFSPDVVITHWNGDYHPDHRACGQLVLDAAFLLEVPLYCPDVPVPDVAPVIGYAYHRFTQPRPIRPDAAVEIDSVAEEKFHVLDCHESQFYEWLPWVNMNRMHFKVAGLSWEERKQHLMYWMNRCRKSAEIARGQLGKVYGEQGRNIQFAEIFEQSEYGRQVSQEDFQKLFPY